MKYFENSYFHSYQSEDFKESETSTVKETGRPQHWGREETTFLSEIPHLFTASLDSAMAQLCEDLLNKCDVERSRCMKDNLGLSTLEHYFL